MTSGHVLKEGRWYAAFGASGWAADADAVKGVFLADVRVVQVWEARLDGAPLVATRTDESEAGVVEIELEAEGHAGIALHLRRRLGQAGLVESWTIVNASGAQLHGRLTLHVGFDMADMVEVRGLTDEGWSREIEQERPREDTVFAHYRAKRDGETDFQVAALLSASRPFEWEQESVAAFDLKVRDGEETEFEVRLASLVGEGTLGAPSGESVDVELARAVGAWRRSLPEIETDDDATNELLARAADDLRMLWTWTGRESGFFAAEAPRRVAACGADALTASGFFLMMLPEQARWTLAGLARHQGLKVHRLSGEEPGKIPHELHGGERSAPDDCPLTFASIEGTLLFPALLDQYLAWSGDVDFAREMEPVLRGILDWCATHGDEDGDGFLEDGAARRARHKAFPRGWVLPRAASDGMVARVEHQGYARDALVACERTFRLLGDEETAATCRTVADALCTPFVDAFHWPAERCLAHGITAEGNRIERVTARQGLCLAGDLIPVELRDDVVARLLSEDFFGPSGVRERADGSDPKVSTRDNAWLAFAMHTRGYRTEANRIGATLLREGAADAASRLPRELPRSDATPVALDACAAAGAFHILRGALGLFPDATRGTVRLMPELRGLPFRRVQVRRLRVAGGELSFDVLQDDGGEARVVPIEKRGDLVVKF